MEGIGNFGAGGKCSFPPSPSPESLLRYVIKKTRSSSCLSIFHGSCLSIVLSRRRFSSYSLPESFFCFCQLLLHRARARRSFGLYAVFFFRPGSVHSSCEELWGPCTSLARSILGSTRLDRGLQDSDLIFHHPPLLALLFFSFSRVS